MDSTRPIRVERRGIDGCPISREDFSPSRLRWSIVIQFPGHTFLVIRKPIGSKTRGVPTVRRNTKLLPLKYVFLFSNPEILLPFVCETLDLCTQI